MWWSIKKIECEAYSFLYPIRETIPLNLSSLSHSSNIWCIFSLFLLSLRRMQNFFFFWYRSRHNSAWIFFGSKSFMANSSFCQLVRSKMKRIREMKKWCFLQFLVGDVKKFGNWGQMKMRWMLFEWKEFLRLSWKLQEVWIVSRLMNFFVLQLGNWW